MKKILLIVIILSLGFSCTNFIENQNVSPNDLLPEAVESKYMIKGVQESNQFFQTGPLARIMMMWMNQATGSDRQYIGLNNWNQAKTSDFDNGWNTAFVTSMFHASETTRKALEEGKPHLAAIAMIIKAETLGIATSLWGDIPYSEAFQPDTYPNPKFDSQVSVYEATQTLLDNAISLLQTPSEIAIENDLYFSGNVEKWIKVAHGLKARFYLHVKDYAKANQQSLLAMSSAADDYRCNFEGETLNHFYEFQVSGRAGYLTSIDAYAPSLLMEGSDNYRGHPGHTNEFFRRFYNYNFEGSNLGVDSACKFTSNGPFPLVTYGEMLFIQTEYEARTNGLSAGVSKYNEYRAMLRTGYAVGNNNNCVGAGAGACGVSYLDYADADFQAGGMENEDNIDPLQAFLRELYEERYIYFIGHYESFTDYRRTNNIAEIKLRPEYENTPQRFLYPDHEINANSSVPSPIPSVEQKTSVNE